METKKTVSDAGTMAKGIISNKLNYTSPPLVNLFNSRQYVKYPAQSQSYTANSTVIVNLSNSEVFVNAKNSYLKFKLAVAGANAVAETWSSVAGIINRTRYIHASGVELCHHRNCNGYASVHNKIHQSAEWQNCQGKLQGYQTLYADGAAATEIAIPLEQICSVFRPMDDTLLPPFLLSGSRIEINLEAAAKAFLWSAAGGSYTITDVEVVLDSYVLSDAAFSMLESMSKAGKVEYSVMDYEVIEGSTGGTNKLNIQLNKSIGRAFETVTVVQKTVTALANGAVNLDDATQNYFKPATFDKIQSYQHRLNSLYMPALPAEGVEKYLNMLQLHHGKDTTHYTNFYTYADFTGAEIVNVPGNPPVPTFFQNHGELIVQSLMRNDFVGVTSGLPINSSSSLRLAVDLAEATNFKAAMYTSYMKIIKPYLYDKVAISV